MTTTAPAPYREAVMRGPEGRPWADLDRAAAVRDLVGALAVGVAADIAVRSGLIGLGGVLLVVAMGGALWASRLANPQARALVVLAVVFGACLAVRASDWLVPLDALAAGGLLVAAAACARKGSVTDLGVPRALVRTVHAGLHVAAAPGFVADAVRPLVRGRGGSSAALLRGLALAVPVVGVIGLLLASADAVFASLFSVPTSVPSLLGHAVLVAIGVWAGAGLLRLASASEPGATAAAARRLGAVEAAVLLGALVALYALFAAAQAVALLGGADRVLETAGLTYAEQARSGFFQLLAAGALTLATLLAVRAAVARDGSSGERRVVVLGEVAVALTLVVVVVAVRRLALYEEAFGLTMLRLFSTVFAAWLGVVFLLLGLHLAGVGRSRAWFLPAATATGLAVLLTLNAVGPEAVVVRTNLAAVERGVELDPGYLGDLSDDAVPALVAALPELSEADRVAVLAAVCAPPFGRRSVGPFAANLSRAAAADARAEVCPAPGGVVDLADA